MGRRWKTGRDRKRFETAGKDVAQSEPRATGAPEPKISPRPRHAGPRPARDCRYRKRHARGIPGSLQLRSPVPWFCPLVDGHSVPGWQTETDMHGPASPDAAVTFPLRIPYLIMTRASPHDDGISRRRIRPKMRILFDGHTLDTDLRELR